jgi:transcriptional regulator with XRE-family HTH domain
MDNILKKLREEAGMTQEAVADELGVAVNTIQNWERTGKIAKESLHGLLDLYGVDQMMRNRVVLSIFGDNCTEEKNVGVDNFPYFLFKERPDIASAARRAILSSEEMELFGYSYYMNGINDSNHDYGHGPRRWPMEYSVFKDYGGYFKTMRILRGIEAKIGDYIAPPTKKANLSRVAYNYGLKYPGAGFTYCALSKVDITRTIDDLPNLEGEPIDISELYSYCNAVREPVCIGTNKTSYLREDTMPAIIKNIVKGRDYWSSRTEEYELLLTDVSAMCICLEKREFEENGYLLRKEQYLSDRKAFDEHPGLYDREPSFEFQFVYYLKLTELGEEYLKWYEG